MHYKTLCLRSNYTGDRIKNLSENKIFSAGKLIKKFHNKNWRRQTLDDFLQKWRTTGSIERTAESGGAA